jgi:hypothetical protein
MKVKFFLGQAMKAQRGEWRCSSTLSLNLALDGAGYLTPRPGRFNLGKETRYLSYRRLDGTPGPVRTGAENLAPHRDSISEPSSRYRVAIPTELSRSTLRHL